MGFSEHFNPKAIEAETQSSKETPSAKVTQVLSQSSWKPQDLGTLLSPAAQEQLEKMAQISNKLTQQRFGKVMQLFVPLYLSNVCYNTCTYCGFSIENEYPRITLSEEEIEKEALYLKKKGFQHLLILTGEADSSSVTYIEKSIRQLSRHFPSIGIEIQPLNTPEYQQLTQAGADKLTVYQETYHPEAYAHYHLRGKKRNFTYRLDTPDRAAPAEFYQMNIGALLGLYDWRFEALALKSHLMYLHKTYWQHHYAISFPRIKEMFAQFTPQDLVTDTDYVQLICAFRMIYPDLGITLSTRESPHLRNHLIKLGITTLSAESKTAPGGYTHTQETEGQFEISDHRSVEEIQALLLLNGYEPVLKNWDQVLHIQKAGYAT
jgi:2-iminoacetate synthase